MRKKVPTSISLFECRCVLRHKPIMCFGSPANALWPECDRGGVISCTGWHTSLSRLGLCRVRTTRPQQSAQRGGKTSSPHEVWDSRRRLCASYDTNLYWTNMFMHKCVHNLNQMALLVNRAISAVSACVWAVRSHMWFSSLMIIWLQNEWVSEKVVNIDVMNDYRFKSFISHRCEIKSMLQSFFLMKRLV